MAYNSEFKTFTEKLSMEHIIICMINFCMEWIMCKKYFTQVDPLYLSLMFMYFCIMVRNTTKIVFKIILRIVLIISDHILLSNFTLVNSISNYSFSHENRDLLCNPSPMREQICTSNVPLMCTEFFTRYKYRIHQQIVGTNISRLSIIEVKKKVI